LDWFAQQLIAWQRQHGRHDLPWQQQINPYRVWVSEIMLQQTQVATVIGYYQRFMQRFPDIPRLAKAPVDDVLHHWTGLGYYARARNLHRAAQIIQHDHAGQMPSTQEQLEALPGIGRSTAGAIRALAMNQHASILDGNVKRVLARFHAISGYPGETKVAKELWQAAETHTPEQHTAIYIQGIMDLGATLCVRRQPNCVQCPMQSRCQAKLTNRVDELPHPKPKKVKPVKTSRFFVVSLPNQATLLEQRPMNGLWGGLWTPPERDSETTVEAFLQELALTPLHLAEHAQGPGFRHTFSHFHLDIEPIYLRITQAPKHIADQTARWVQPQRIDAENEPLGLSAVAVKLLAELKHPQKALTL
jgi:A/G-specific adenine glycosylase